MKIEIQAICDKGRVRENNEDALSIGGTFLRDDAINLTVDVQENAVFYLLVSDGMGGHEKGEEASKITLEELKEQFAMNEIQPDTFIDDINEAGKYISYKLNNAAYDQGQSKPMGCTLTGVVWHYGKIYLVNAGDSRTYRFRGGILRQLSTDQTERGITDNPQASKALLNCIGGGLTGKVLTDDEIEALLNEGITTDGMGQGLAEKLKEKACEAGGYDNVSIILAKL